MALGLGESETKGKCTSRIAARDRRDGRDGRRFEVRSSTFSERRTLGCAFSLVSRFTRHDLWRWRTLFSILLRCRSYDGFFARILCGAKRSSGAEDLFQGQEGIASRVPFDPSDQTLVGIGA